MRYLVRVVLVVACVSSSAKVSSTEQAGTYADGSSSSAHSRRASKLRSNVQALFNGQPSRSIRITFRYVLDSRIGDTLFAMYLF